MFFFCSVFQFVYIFYNRPICSCTIQEAIEQIKSQHVPSDNDSQHEITVECGVYFGFHTSDDFINETKFRISMFVNAKRKAHSFPLGNPFNKSIDPFEWDFFCSLNKRLANMDRVIFIFFAPHMRFTSISNQYTFKSIDETCYLLKSAAGRKLEYNFFFEEYSKKQ